MGKLDSLFDEVEKQGSLDSLFDEVEAQGSQFSGMGDVKAAEFAATNQPPSTLGRLARNLAPLSVAASQAPRQAPRPYDASRMPSSFADFPGSRQNPAMGLAPGLDALSLPSRALATTRGMEMSDPGANVFNPEAAEIPANVEAQNAANPYRGQQPTSFADFGQNAISGPGQVILQAAGDPLSYGTVPLKPIQSIARGIKSTPELLGRGLEAVGESQMRRVVKPLMRHERKATKPIEETIFEYGLDKGKGGASPKAIYDRSSQELNRLGAQLKAQIRQGKDQGARVNTDAIISQTIADFKAAKGETPEFYSMAPDLEDIAKDFKDRARQANAKGFGDLDLLQAQNFKQYLGHEGAWQHIAKAKGIPVTAKETARSQFAEDLYHRLNDAIDEASPSGVRDINRQISELIPVNQTTGWRQVVEGRQNNISLNDVIGMTATAINPKVWPVLVLNRMSKSGTVASKIYRIGEALRKAKTPAEEIRYTNALKKLGLSESEISAAKDIARSSGGEGVFEAQELRVQNPINIPKPKDEIKPISVITNQPTTQGAQPGGLEWQVAGVRRRQAEKYLQSTLKRDPNPQEVKDFLAANADKDIPKAPEPEIQSREFKGRRTSRELEGLDNLLKNGDPEWPTQTTPIKNAPDAFTIGGMELKRTKSQWDNQIVYKDKQGKTYSFRGDEQIHMDAPKDAAPKTPETSTPKDDFYDDNGKPLFQSDKLFSPKGQIVRRDGKSDITLFKDRADVSTLMHEHAHWLRSQALDEAQQSKALKTFGAGKWDREAEEKFARGFERYLYDGESPHESLNPAFKTMKDRFSQIYKETKGTEIEAQLPEEMRLLYDAILLRGIKPTPKSKAILKAIQKQGVKQSQRTSLINMLARELNKEEDTNQ
jgi:hypothetical protein